MDEKSLEPQSSRWGEAPEETSYYVSRARHHMLDVLDSLRAISASANSQELENTEDMNEFPSDDGKPLVAATVGHGGELKSLEISPAAMRTDMAQLGRVIVATVELAAKKSAIAHNQLMCQSILAIDD